MIRSTVFALAALTMTSVALSHCQVPCGIYGDQRRFESMLEDTQTIAKAQKLIGELSSGRTAQDFQQAVRWTTTKEEHAANIQKTIAAYFMAQRIKTDDGQYAKKLMASHKVIVAAMKAKQSADPATAKALEKAIFDFYRAYEGREPNFESKK